MDAKGLVLLLSVECQTVRAGMERSASQNWRGNKHSRQRSKILKHIIRNSTVLETALSCRDSRNSSAGNLEAHSDAECSIDLRRFVGLEGKAEGHKASSRRNPSYRLFFTFHQHRWSHEVGSVPIPHRLLCSHWYGTTTPLNHTITDLTWRRLIPLRLRLGRDSRSHCI